MWMLRLALKNLLRNKKRIVLSLISVVAGVALYILGQGFNNGLGENILRAQIDKVSGHVLLRPGGYETDTLSPDLDALFAIDPAAAKWLDAHSVAWTRRVTFAPDAIVGPDLVRLRGLVYEPGRDEAVFPHTEWELVGEMPADDGVMIGSGVARLLDLEVGEWMTLRTRTTGGAINALEVPVRGIVTTGSPMIDAATVLLPWSLGDSLLRNAETTSHVNIRLPSRDDAEAFAPLAAEQVGHDVEFGTWQTETEELMALQDVRRNMYAFIAFAILGMAATGIANTILMAAYERVREIGTLRAMGMTRTGVVQLFVIEGALLGLIGSALGVLVGGYVVWNGSVNGMDMTEMLKAKEEAITNVPMSVMLYMDFDPVMLAIAGAFGVVVAIGASVYPAFAATQIAPADAVRA